MAMAELQKDEKKTLISEIVGLAIFVLLIIGWEVYLLLALRLSLEAIKKLVMADPELIAYAFIPMLVVGIWAFPRGTKLWNDVSSNTVEEGAAEVVNVGRSWLSKGWFLTLNEPGKDKIRITRKAFYELTPGKKIKFRIAPVSKTLVGYQILK